MMSSGRRTDTETVCTLYATRLRRFALGRLGSLRDRSGNREVSILSLPMEEDGICEVRTIARIAASR